MTSSPTRSTFATTQDAIHMNHRGLHCLESGMYPEAVSAFSGALSAVKGVLALEDLELEEHTAVVAKGFTPSSASKLIFAFYDPTGSDGIVHAHAEDGSSDSATPHCTGCINSTSAESEFLEDDGSPFIFRTAINVGYTATTSREEKQDFASLVKFSAAILFNLALTYHLAATVHMDQDGERQKRLLLKALTFYKLAYTMLQDTGNDGATETMAIANNLGHVHLSVGDNTKARQCYEHLLSTIMLITHTGEDRASIRHFDGFFRNVQTMVLSNACKNAAEAA